MACRNTEKGEQARQEVVEETGNEQVLVRELDLGSLESVQKFAKEFNESEAGIENSSKRPAGGGGRITFRGD